MKMYNLYLKHYFVLCTLNGCCICSVTDFVTTHKLTPRAKGIQNSKERVWEKCIQTVFPASPRSLLSASRFVTPCYLRPPFRAISVYRVFLSVAVCSNIICVTVVISLHMPIRFCLAVSSVLPLQFTPTPISHYRIFNDVKYVGTTEHYFTNWLHWDFRVLLENPIATTFRL
jgi:hypothetical protein